ncbi:MAG: Asp23/Gls24 family envelope stress response protein [Olsenella sp.]
MSTESASNEQGVEAEVMAPETDVQPADAVAPDAPTPADEPSDGIDLSTAEDEDLESEDSLTFSNGVIEKIVALAMREVPDVVGMKGSWFNRVQETFGTTDSTKGVSVEVTPESSVKVNVSVFIKYGAYAPQVFEDVKHAVVKQVTGMTGLEVAGVNLRIEDVLTPEEYDKSKAAPEVVADSADVPAEDPDSEAAAQ